MKRTKLQAARARKRWTLEQAAEAIGVGVTSLHQWEQGNANPYPRNKHRVCEVYGATAADLDLEEDIETSKAEAAVGTSAEEPVCIEAVLTVRFTSGYIRRIPLPVRIRLVFDSDEK